jgi:hypothetical protein
MYYIPDSEKNTYLKEISSLVVAIRRQDNIQSIAKAEDIATVREQLLDWVSASIDAGVPETKARMVRLEARQGAAAAAAEGIAGAPANLSLIPVTVITMAEDRHIVLCEDTELASSLEKKENLEVSIQQKGQFDQGAYRLVFRSSTSYPHGRILTEFLAIKRA